MKIIAILLVAALSTKIPLVGKFVSVINTMIHESGHALMALLMSGRVHKIVLFANTEGTAFTSHSFWLAKVMTSLSGYVASSATAYTFIVLLSKGQYKLVLWILVVITVANLLLWVRNFYGVLWLIVFLAVSALLLYAKNPLLLNGAVVYIVGVMWAASLISSFGILTIGFSRPDSAGDAANLAQATFVPAAVWGIFFAAQALWFSLLSVRTLVPLIK